MESEQPLHDEAMLLPGYVSQTLSSEQQQQVVNHLKTCLTCQHELQEVTNMHTAIKTSIGDRPGPSPAAFSTLMRRIEKEKQALQPQARGSLSTSWLETVEAAFRSLFAVQWVPTLASVLIIGQAFLLFSMMDSPEGHNGQGTGVVIERGIPQGAPPQTSSLKIRLSFQPDAQEQHIRTFLHTIQGRIIDGPSSKGTYTMAIAPQNTVSLETILTELRQNAKLIRLAEPLHP